MKQLPGLSSSLTVLRFDFVYFDSAVQSQLISVNSALLILLV